MEVFHLIKNKHFLKNLLVKIDNRWSKKSEIKPDVNYLHPLANTAIALINKFKNVENDASEKIIPIFTEDIYITFLKYLEANSEGDKIPRSDIIESALNITKTKRLELSNKALNDNILIKANKGYKYNINQDKVINMSQRREV